MPVTEIATSALEWAMAPADMASATSALTAPTRAINSAGTLSSSVFASLEYVTKPRSTTLDEPGISVSAPAIRPPVQDSAVASFHPAGIEAREDIARLFKDIFGEHASILPSGPKQELASWPASGSWRRPAPRYLRRAR